MNKLIGIVGSLMSQKNGLTGYGVNAAYLEYWRQYGDVIVIDPATGVLPINLLVMPGGADLDTTRYGQVPSIHTGNANQFLEYFDKVQLPKYVQACAEGKLSIWGTCRGSQSLAVHFGVSLVQDIYTSYSTKSRAELVDKVILNSATQPFNIPAKWTGRLSHKDLLEINSLHHQGFMVSEFEGTDLLPLAVNKDSQPDGDTNVEFFRHKTLKIAAGQHHNEECYDPYSKMLIDWLLNNQDNNEISSPTVYVNKKKSK